MKRFLAVFVIFAVAAAFASAQDPGERRIKIMRAVDARDRVAAIEELLALRSDNENAFIADEYDYLLARMAEANGQFGLALANYQAVSDRESVLRPYALKHISQIARSTGNLLLERIYLNQILMLEPGPLFAQDVSFRLARNSYECGNFAESIRILSTALKPRDGLPGPEKTSRGREPRLLLADALLRTGQTERARGLYEKLIAEMPNASQPDDIALGAVKALDLMDGGVEAPVAKAPVIAEDEHLRRANIYQFNREFAGAKLHFDAVIANDPTGANTSDAVFQIGRGFMQRADYVEALKWFERILEQYPQSVAARDALLQAGSAYARVGKHKEAIKRYQSFIERYPLDEKLDRAYLNIVDIHRDQGEDSDAIRWCVKTEEVFRNRQSEAIAIFAEARIRIAREEWPLALELLDRLAAIRDLGGAAVPGGTSIAEVTFLKAFVLESMKRYADAIDTYLSIDDGRAEYYGWRATERLMGLAKDETANSFLILKAGTLATGLKAKDADQRRKNATAILRISQQPELREKALSVLKAAMKTLPKYQGPPGYKLAGPAKPQNTRPLKKSAADTLLFLGLYDEATPEIVASSPIFMKGSDDNTFTLATYYLRGDRGDKAIGYIEAQWKQIPADYPIEAMPRDQLELLYPAPYPDTLLKYAPSRGVDPRLLLAVMRQESRFQPDAKSYAAARGLMQFISTTSLQIASELGRNNFGQDDLYQPSTAILFGSQYVADLFKTFRDQPEAVAASYNGGDDNMKRWFGRARSGLPDRYVPEILFAQSKDYVYKVMANYRMYRYLYDEQLRLR